MYDKNTLKSCLMSLFIKPQIISNSHKNMYYDYIQAEIIYFIMQNNNKIKSIKILFQTKHQELKEK